MASMRATPMRKWSKSSVLALAIAAISCALLIDVGDRTRSFVPVWNAVNRKLGFPSASPPSVAAAWDGVGAAAGQVAQWGRRLSGDVGPAPAPGAANDTHHGSEDHGEEHEGHSDSGLLFAALILGIGALLKLGLDSAGQYFPLPYTVALVLIGGLLGSLNSLGACHVLEDYEDVAAAADVNCSSYQHNTCLEHEDVCYFESSLPSSLGMLGDSISIWAGIHPGFLLFFFIPALVYASAQTVDVHIFRESFINVVTLAVPGVLMATYLMFAFFYFTYGDNPRYGWSFDACMCFGSILAATDPVAVVALLNDLGAPHKLSIVIEGESLLNDGTALVLFTIFSDALLSIERSTGDQFLFFFRLALGGMGVGVAAGLVSVLVFTAMRSWVHETTWTIAAAYLTFFLCENENVQFSGVLGVVFLGITISLYGGTRIDHIDFLQNFWTMWNFIANTLIFSITGVIVAESVFFEEYVTAEDWVTLLVV